MKCNCFGVICFAVKILFFSLEDVSFVCICIIVSLSKSNPFKSHIIGNIDKYYSYVFSNDDIYSFKNYTHDNISINATLLKEKIFNDSDILQNKNALENINKSSLNISNYKKIFKRKLESSSFCIDMYDSLVRNNGKRLSYIFDLNYETIHGISIALLVVILVFIVSSTTCFIMYICSYDLTRLVPNIIGYITIISFIAKFILFILLFHYIENGDIEKYDDFLDCRYVRTNYFKKFHDIEKFRKCFICFTISNLLSQIFDKINNLLEASIKAAELPQNHPPVLSSSTVDIKQN